MRTPTEQAQAQGLATQIIPDLETLIRRAPELAATLGPALDALRKYTHASAGPTDPPDAKHNPPSA